MNRFDRITAILVQLQAKRLVPARELAERFGVSLRTIYRDVRTLEQAGVPVCGEAGAGYSLAEGYRLPPVMFTREEATALITAEKLVAQLTDAHTAQLSQAAMDKLRAVLRRTDRDYLEALSPHISVYKPWGAAELTTHHDTYQQLLTSLAARRVVRLEYRAGYSGEASVREVEPLGLYYGQQWHLVAYCRLRQAHRDFRLDRIAHLHVSGEAFEPRADTLASYWQQKAAERQLTKAVVRFGPAPLQPHLAENKYYFGWASEQAVEGGAVEMTFWTSSLDEMARWLLLHAGQATVLEPPALHQRVRELVQQLQQHFC